MVLLKRTSQQPRNWCAVYAVYSHTDPLALVTSFLIPCWEIAEILCVMSRK